MHSKGTCAYMLHCMYHNSVIVYLWLFLLDSFISERIVVILTCPRLGRCGSCHRGILYNTDIKSVCVCVDKSDISNRVCTLPELIS